MDVLATAAPAGLPEPLGPAPRGSALTGPDDLVSDRFREAMSRSPDAVSPAFPASPPGQGQGPGQPASLGDAVLAGVTRMSSQLQQAWSETRVGLAADLESWSPARLLKFQGQVLEVSMIFDVATKGVSKAIQDVEQLTKMQ